MWKFVSQGKKEGAKRVPAWSVYRGWGASLCLAMTGIAYAGPASVTPKELDALRQLVKTDSSAAEQLKELRAVAEKAKNEQPQPIAKLIGEGRLASDPKRIATRHALLDLKKVEALSWVGVISNIPEYRQAAIHYIVEWAKVNKSDGNPINETGMEPIVVAFDLVKSDMSGKEKQTVIEWLRHRATALINNKRSIKENWQSHRLKMVGLIGLAIDDSDLWNYAEQGFKEQLDKNFSDNGESVDFVRRDAVAYHLYTVEPLLDLACAGKGIGENMFTYEAENGASLKEAVDFTLPYISGEKRHVEYVRTQVKFDIKRAQHDGTHKQRPFNAKRAIPMLSEASCFSQEYSDIARGLNKKKNERYLNWDMVVNSIK